MKNTALLFVILLVTGYLPGQKNADTDLNVLKDAAQVSVDHHQAELIRLSDQVWGFAELAMREYQSAKVLADYAEMQGFKVTRGVAKIPTAFIAEYGSGKPVIGILGEFDALPGMSQHAIPSRKPLKQDGAGHACGHNLFGTGSLGAAIAIKELIQKGSLQGTIRYYGTPAEEDLAGKVYMARDGLFDDLDVCLDWHPDDQIKANMQSSQAIIDNLYIFKGRSAHAAYDPWNGRSALDAAELFTDGINMLREHVRPSVRLHYVYPKAGDVPNVIPAEAHVWLWIRDSKRSGVTEVEKRVADIAKGAALMAGVEYEIKLNSGLYEILVNETGARTLQSNLELLGPIVYTPEEEAFAEEIMTAYGLPDIGMKGMIQPLESTRPDPQGGSTDVGDVSFIVPEISLQAATAPLGAPWHSWVVVACGGMSIGHKGMLFAAKALAMTMVDLFTKPELVQEIKDEFLRRKGNEVWKPMLPEGTPPVPVPTH